MSKSRTYTELSPGAGTGSRRTESNWRNHAGLLLALMLLVPSGAHGATADREYTAKLAQHLSQELPGLTAEILNLSATPTCSPDAVELRAVRPNVFGTSTLVLRCTDSQSLSFTASVTTKLARPQPVPSKVLAIRSGSKVRVEITTQGLAIYTTGTVLGPGAIGDVIRIRTAGASRVLRAQIVDSSTVRAIGDQR